MIARLLQAAHQLSCWPSDAVRCRFVMLDAGVSAPLPIFDRHSPKPEGAQGIGDNSESYSEGVSAVERNRGRSDPRSSQAPRASVGSRAATVDRGWGGQTLGRMRWSSPISAGGPFRQTIFPGNGRGSYRPTGCRTSCSTPCGTPMPQSCWLPASTSWWCPEGLATLQLL